MSSINGYTLGGGVEFACACDVRIASENSILFQPKIDIGVIPGWGGTQRLARIAGITKAKEMIYTGQRIKAQEAMAIMTMGRTMASKGKTHFSMPRNPSTDSMRVTK